jgi:ribosomal protein S18 acetylase RimI-like enzyme
MGIIRPCIEKDIPLVVDLQQQWRIENITHGFVPATKEDLLERLNNLFFVAEDTDNDIGFVYGTIHTSDGLAVIPKGEKYIEIDDIYVHLEHRDKGVGQELIDAILTEAKSRGVERSLIYSATKNWEQVVNFYKKNDFKMWFVQMYR